MIRRLVPAALAVAVLAAGCGSGDEATPLDPDKLTIYSAQHDNLVDAWVKGFTDETGVQVQVRQGSDSSMGNQIVAEGSRSPADVFLTENSPAITVVQDADLLAPVDQSTLDQVDPAFRPSNGLWTGIAARSTVLVYNPSLVSEADLPASMMDLAEPEYAGKWGAAPAGADFQAIVAGDARDEGRGGHQRVARRAEEEREGLPEQHRHDEGRQRRAGADGRHLPLLLVPRPGADQGRQRATPSCTTSRTRTPARSSASPGAACSSRASTPRTPRSSWRGSPAARARPPSPTSKSMEYAVGKGQPSDPALPPLASLEAPTIDPFTLDGPAVIELMTQAGII